MVLVKFSTFPSSQSKKRTTFRNGMGKGEILLHCTLWKELVAVPGLRLAPKHWTVTIYNRQNLHGWWCLCFTETRKTKLYSFYVVHSVHFMSKYTVYRFLSWRNSPSGSGPHYRGFMITDTRHSIWLLWKSDQPDAEISTWQCTTLTTDKHLCPAGFEPTFPASERPHTHA
jgi:hypothetical protein